MECDGNEQTTALWEPLNGKGSPRSEANRQTFLVQVTRYLTNREKTSLPPSPQWSTNTGPKSETREGVTLPSAGFLSRQTRGQCRS